MAEPPTLGRTPRARSRSPELRVLELLGNAGLGGMESYVTSLVGALPSTVRTTVALPFDGALAQGLRERRAHVVVQPVSDGSALFTSVLRTVELARRLRADVIHAHLGNAHAVAAAASAICGVPTFATVHSQYVPMRDWEVLALGWSRLGVVCDAAYAHARTLGAGAGQVGHVPNGVDTSRFSPGPRVSPERWGIPAGVPLVGFVGRLELEKGPTDFVHACAGIAARVPDAHFVIAGDGSLRERCTAVATRRGIADRLHCLGWIDDMTGFYRALDVLVCTSLSEGSPLAVLEAMACEVPVVASAVGGVPEIIADGVHGALVEPGAVTAVAQAATDLLADAARRASMGRAARAHVGARHSLRQHVTRLVEELQRTARRGDGRVESLEAARARAGQAGRSGQ